MTLQDFINKYNGQPIDFDGAYGKQCVDLMNQYCVDVLSISSPIQVLSGATAYEIYQNFSGNQFQKIDNTPLGVPQPGDIIFWNTTIGSAGHVAVFISGDTNSFTSFDQNWPEGSFCHPQAHDYTGVAGWLHPVQVQQPVTVPVESTTFQQLVDKATKYDAFNAAGYTTIDDVTKALNDIQLRLTQCQTQLQTAQQMPEPQVSSTQLPVNVTTSNGTTSVPITVTSTDTPPSATQPAVEENPTTPSQTIDLNQPVSQSPKNSRTIVSILVSIWKFLIG